MLRRKGGDGFSSRAACTNRNAAKEFPILQYCLIHRQSYSALEIILEEENMKRLVIAVLAGALIFGIGIGTASAANGLKAGQVGMSVDVNNDFVLSGRYFFTDDLALIAQFGFGIKGDDGSGTDIGLGASVRKYLSTKEDLAPFVDGNIFYKSTEDGDVTSLAVLAEFGAEYFLHKQFSVEGRIGFGYQRDETTFAGTTTTITTVGTQRFGLSLNYYFF